MIDTAKGIIDAIRLHAKMNYSERNGESQKTGYIMARQFVGEMYCPTCGASRKHDVHLFTSYSDYIINEPDDEIIFPHLPLVFIAECLQCNTKTSLVLYKGPEGNELALLRNAYGGYVTEHTPNEVKYYLDQAYRSRMVSALSAAMAMYRSALEWILFDQGYKKGMLNEKITSLENDIKKGSATKWALNLPVEFLTAIKSIGNGAIHTNKGDIDKQLNITESLMENVDVVFSELLDVIYEQPIRRQKNLDRLTEIANQFR